MRAAATDDRRPSVRCHALASSAPVLQPVAPAERIVTLDVLRGFALLGILLMNIEGFVGPLDTAMTGLDPLLRGADRIADAAVYLLVQGKFYTLFSLLFGMGFAVMAQRAEAARRQFGGFFVRRSAVLLLIGVLHAVLLWSGDILVSYALLAFMLLAFREAPTRWLPWMALAVYLCSPLLSLLTGAIGSAAQADPHGAMQWRQDMAEQAQRAAAALEQQRQVFGHGSYAQATAQRLRDLIDALGTLVFNAPTIFGMFLLGAWCVRSGLAQQPQRHPRLLAALRWGVLPLGLALMLLSFRLEPWMDPARLDLRLAGAFALATVASGMMALGYAAWLLRFASALRWLAPAGRMALSNYLLQSLLCTMLFYGYGLGYFERLPRVWQIPFAFALFALQVALSQLWLRHFRFGPVEWLWRSASYLRWQPLRRHGTS
ncbi:DUF418 domain-containing protein [Xanthomonas sp. SI]|uniref:DUF418 domain-containing protein n=1 Tax=Xanthomonas sp. SI TaxID=2724123 RepID=UPI001639A8F9|nr:DUF418 domain-containing protein [Xanthomonas sp. SI]QNH13295.1 hypothetical protein HEP75_02746 [Xanthomonas sp. SI]